MKRIRHKILLRALLVTAAALAILGGLLTQLAFHTMLASERASLLKRLDAVGMGLETAWAGYAIQGITPEMSLLTQVAAQYEGVSLAISAGEADGMYLSGHVLRAQRVLTLGEARYCLRVEADVQSVWESRAVLLAGFRILWALSLILCALSLRAVSSGITRPIEQLDGVSQRLEKGDLQARAPVDTDDETGRLAHSFNRMADELTGQLSRQKRFIGGLTHEMKTPLAAILGHADLLRSGKLQEEEALLAAQTILREAGRLNALSERMTEWILLGQEEIQKQDTSMRLLMEELKDAFSTREAQICVEGDAILPVDRALMKALLANLVDNALHAGARNIRLRTERTGESVCLRVQDDGEGMSEETLRRATEPFYRQDKARSRAHGGAGLGLALCREIALLHGAELTFESQQGQGAVAVLSFGKEGDNA